MKEHLHEGLTVHTRIYYTLQRGKRVFNDDPPSDRDQKDSWFEFDAHMYPPTMLMPTTWKRYGYTLEDVHTTYEKMDASYVWQIALMLLCGTYEPEAASAGVRPTFQSPFTFLFISRKTVFDVFISAQSEFISPTIPGGKGVLCLERKDHKPPLPKVLVPRSTWEDAKSILPVRSPSFCWTPEYPRLFRYKDITLVPVDYDETNKLVYMVRIVKQSVYDQIPIKPKKCVVTLPVYVMVGPTSYVMTEEACFYAIDQNPKPTMKDISQLALENKTESILDDNEEEKEEESLQQEQQHEQQKGLVNNPRKRKRSASSSLACSNSRSKKARVVKKK